MPNRTSLISGLLASLLFVSGAAQALTIKPFTTAEFAAAQAAGAPVAVHFRADWCPTCRAQDKAFNTLKSDPALNSVTLLLADYDKEKALKKQMNVRSQSTIIVFKGTAEVARDGGTTEADKLKAVLGKAL